MFAVFDSILSAPQVAQLRSVLLPERFSDGAATAHGDAKRVKNNLQFTPGHPQWQACSNMVLGAINACQPLSQYALPIRMTLPLFNLYGEGMHYGQHTDAAMMSANGWPMRSDYSMTVFLSNPDEYDGGELVFADAAKTTREVKLSAGSAVIYPSNTLHEVRTVTRGRRFAAVLWLQSALPLETQRNIVQQLDQVRLLIDQGADARDQLRLARENLVRMFAQP